MPNKPPATPEILIVSNKKEEKFLRKKTALFDFSQYTKKEIQDLIARMKKIMHAANGVGLSANQIGLDMKVFVAEVPDAEGGHKFYAIFNPEIEKVSEDKNVLEEGCLSIPGIFGDVPRASRIAIKAQDKNGRAVKIKAWGFLARVFQHEIDHLIGHVFTDRTKKLYTEE
jgi:peptide deformylase